MRHCKYSGRIENFYPFKICHAQDDCPVVVCPEHVEECAMYWKYQKEHVIKYDKEYNTSKSVRHPNAKK